ncbi:unnamed protein product [Prorocentrum cordatum]|uniref:Uncharacterized protein n=1 Tax=Prorocentrum cordatum TaxID=2364126 RepID=A0ABN9S1G1_9DINO|nr:unnamed protein product [Polarella glacialis]
MGRVPRGAGFSEQQAASARTTARFFEKERMYRGVTFDMQRMQQKQREGVTYPDKPPGKQ